MKNRKRRFLWLLLPAAALALLPFSCGTTYPRRDPVGQPFPEVRGESLDGEEVALPDALAGGPAVLFVGYEQESQFDIDRWLLGLDQAGVAARVLELPTIPGLGGRVASRWIDRGMRKGIPKEDWAGVVTLYRDAAPVARFLGNENPMPARVVLLDASGRVAGFHD